MSMDFGWEEWQLQLLDDYILGYAHFDTQQELSRKLGKNLNSVKIKLTRRKKEISEEKRILSMDEYVSVLANRFSKNTEELAIMMKLSPDFLLEQMDELDCLECKEFLMDGYQTREMTNDEYELFVKMYKIKGFSSIKISHILNRPINSIQEMIAEYERV